VSANMHRSTMYGKLSGAPKFVPLSSAASAKFSDLFASIICRSRTRGVSPDPGSTIRTDSPFAR